MRGLFLILILSIITACGGQVTGEEYLARAKSYIGESDFSAATIELQNALKQDPDLAEARWLLGQIYLGSGNVPAAEHEFKRAQEMGWRPDDTRPALAKTWIALGRSDEVLEMDSADLGPSGSASLLSMQALAALASGQPDKAEELIAQAEKGNAQSAEVKLGRATVLLANKNFVRALREVEEAIEIEPDNHHAWRLKAQALMRLNLLEEARDALDQSIALSSFAFTDRIARALINMQFEEFDAAQADVSVLLEIAPQDPSANYVQGLVHFHKKDYLSAIESLNAAEPIAYQYPLTYYFLAAAYQFEQDVDLSANYAAKFLGAMPTSGAGRKLRAITLIQTGHPDEVQEILRPWLDVSPNDLEALNILANAMLLSDQAYAGFLTYKRIDQLDPDWDIVPLRRESMLVTRGSGEVEGLPEAAGAGTDPNFPQTEILKIREHVANEDLPAAIEVARSYQFRDIESLSPYHVLGKIYMAAEQKEEARKAFNNALKRDPDDSFAIMNLAQLELQDNDPEAARAYYQSILEKDPSNLGALSQLATLEAAAENHVEVERLLELAYKAHPDVIEPRLNLARFYMSRGTPDRVHALFADVNEAQRNSPRVLQVIGLALVAAQRFEQAIGEFEQLVEAQPESAQAYYLLALANSGAGNTERSKESLHKALEIDETHLSSLLSLAKMAQKEEDSKEAARYLDKLTELAPDSIEVLRLQAWVAQEEGDNDQAIKHLERAFTLAPSSQTVTDLASLQWSEGQEQQARAFMEKWIAENPNDIPARIILAGHLQAGIDVPGAIKQYEAVLDIQPANVVALNNLAWSIRHSDTKKAYEYINRAIMMLPDNPAVLDTLAVIEHIMGSNNSALKHVNKALKGAPTEPSIRYHAAMIHAALGDKAEAAEILKAITAEGAADFPYRDEALALLQQVGG